MSTPTPENAVNHYTSYTNYTLSKVIKRLMEQLDAVTDERNALRDDAHGYDDGYQEGLNECRDNDSA